MYNIKDLPKFEEELRAAEGNWEVQDELLQLYTGPGCGLTYTDEGKLVVVDGWWVNGNGDIRPVGPGMENEEEYGEKYGK